MVARSRNAAAAARPPRACARSTERSSSSPTSSSGPCATCARRYAVPLPSQAAARHTRVRSPVGSAAATSTAVSSGRATRPAGAGSFLQFDPKTLAHWASRIRRQLMVGQIARKFQQRQRVAPGLGDDLITDSHIERRGPCHVLQCPSKRAAPSARDPARRPANSADREPAYHAGPVTARMAQ